MKSLACNLKLKTPKRQNSEVLALRRRGYHFGSKIGKGSYGYVVKVNYIAAGVAPIQLACKYMDMSTTPKDFLDKFFPREIELLQKLSHPNIIGIHSIIQSGNTIFIFMRYAENGDLLDYIKKHGVIGEPQANLWFYQMVSSIKYIHSLGYSHRDLKCENILISRHMNIKIADFGFARKCVDENNENLLSSTFCGSAAYAAPEVIKGNSYDPMKSDVWSLGVILFIMTNGMMPFDDNNMGKLIRDQKERRYHIREEIVGKLSQDCKSMIHALLEPNPKIRCNINTVFEMNWLRKHVERNLLKA